MENRTKMTAQGTISILKAMHYANACQFFIGTVISEEDPKMNAKKFLTDLQKKALSIITDLKLKISDSEKRNELKQDVSDPLAADAILDTYIALTAENRQNFEEIGSFILDSQIAAEKRKENGYSAHFDERIGHSLEPLLQFRKETERHLKLINQQIEILENHKKQQ